MSSNVCATCSHPKVDEIDRLIRSGASIRGLAQTYNLSKTGLYRHKAHMDEEQARRKSDVSFEDKTSIERITEIEKIARDLISRAASSGKISGVAPLLRAANESLSIACKLRGEMTGKPIETAIDGIPWGDFHIFTNSLLAALDDQPVAKKAVLDAILTLPHGGDVCEST